MSTSSAPGPVPSPVYDASTATAHAGVVLEGNNGSDGPKAFYIHLDAKPDKVTEVRQMLVDILAVVESEPDTGPWYAVQYTDTVFGIFEVFPSITGRQLHVDGGGGDIFRDLARMNDLLRSPAHVYRLDALLAKQVFTASVAGTSSSGGPRKGET